MMLLNILLVPFLVLILLGIVIVIGSLGLVSGSAGSYHDQSSASYEYNDVSPYCAIDENDLRLEKESEPSARHASTAFPAPSSQLDFESSLNIITM